LILFTDFIVSDFTVDLLIQLKIVYHSGYRQGQLYLTAGFLFYPHKMVRLKRAPHKHETSFMLYMISILKIHGTITCLTSE